MDTEREFLASLRTIYDVYARPLRKLCSISDDEQKQLFSGVEPVLSVSNMLLTKVNIALVNSTRCRFHHQAQLNDALTSVTRAH